jgi:Dolichyl-phosphate-mannose-protein mannosyltransferase
MEAVSRPATTPDETTINAELAEHAEKLGPPGSAVSAFDVVRAQVALAVVVALAAALRFYGLAWGAPYFHFHIDEHFVFVGAERLRVGMRAAAMSGKFFMYGPLPMHMLNGIVWLYETIKAPLALTLFQDQVTYMVMGRAISAALGTATVVVVYFVGKRVSNAVGGVVAAALLATTVVHIAESHSFRVDLAMIFFASLAWLFALRIAESGRLRDYLWAGAFAGAAIGSKYSAAFIVGVIGVAHLIAPGPPREWNDRRGWLRWIARGVSPLVVCAMTFAVINPMAFLYYDRFRQDIQEQIVNPLTGGTRPLWVAQFTDVQPQLYWFTTNFWWGFGPAMELWGLAGIGWLIWRRTPAAIVAAAFPLIYFLTAGGTTAPMARYALPLAPSFAVAAGGLSAYLMEQPRWRRAAIAMTAIVLAGTTLYALAYMNIYRARDARLAASDFLVANVPEGSRILVEPSHGIPPLGSYLRNPNFSGDHVMWGATTQRNDYYSFYTLDAYVYLYGRRATPEQKHQYIQSRLDQVDFIVMDDFYVQLYRHLPADTHGVVKQYYDDLFSGLLGFDLIRTFKVYPSLFGVTINDDGAELSSRMNDHPRVYIFMRRQPR